MEPIQNQESIIFTDQPPVTYGSFWERFAAMFIDGIILAIVNFLVGLLVSGWPFFAGNVVTIIIGWLYYALQESGSNQATVGKRAMGLRVTDLNGHRVSFARATGRHFGKIISAIIIFIGYFMMIWDDRNQTLHDKMAGTLIVK